MIGKLSEESCVSILGNITNIVEKTLTLECRVKNPSDPSCVSAFLPVKKKFFLYVVAKRSLVGIAVSCLVFVSQRLWSRPAAYEAWLKTTFVDLALCR